VFGRQDFLEKPAVFFLGGVALYALAGLLDFGLVSGLAARPYDVRYVPRSDSVRVAALGHRTLVSDLYWLQAVQYVGEPKAEQRGWDKLYPLIDLVTDLDPRHGYAFQTAGKIKERDKKIPRN